jgi:putative tryptophan/tyrosine transport system substrate-binding protein
MGRYVAWGTALLTVMIVVLTALGRPLLAAAQQPGHVPRIAFLGLNFPPAASEPTPFLDAFRQGLRERGWVEGHNLVIEWRWAEGNLARFASLVADLVRLPVDVLVVPNAATAQIAQQATTTIPIVVVIGGSLLEKGLIASLAHPGGNVTGLSSMGPELDAKKLALLKEALPGVTQVAVLRGLSDFAHEWHMMEGVARSLGVELHLFEVREPTAFDSAFAAMTTAHVHALLVFGDPSFVPYRAQIVALAAQHQLPSICADRGSVEMGCLMSYGTSARDRGPRIAAYVDKILKGAQPADLPVEQPMKFELVVNLKTAKALDLTLSPMFLFQADEVIQ